ncbi:MAG: hypothetical protein NC097_03490 [Clostridium sp.]|nr:hypothetical protein [Prevotella sp.]MCM1428841.1 hypothetical protein [Clostridium sp.]MCM1475216.1 hypothetical protein [Muribaculaceae bacterium]
MISDNIFDFVEKHLLDDPGILRLRYSDNDNRNQIFFAIDQVECRSRFSKKLPSFLANPKFVFPTVLSGEQATHEEVAQFHATLISPGDKKILDMTSGLGIDSMTIAQNHNVDITSIDIDSCKTETLKHNCQVLKIKNLQPICADSLKFLERCQADSYDLIFVDPARRSDSGSRVFGFTDSRPDIISNWDRITHCASRILIKASPMVDINRAIHEIPNVRSIYIVSRRGECKELLIESQRDYSSEVKINVVEIGNGEIRRFEFDLKTSQLPVYVADTEGFEGKYLCIPDAGIMKSAAWGELTAKIGGLRKLAVNTHLFVADTKPDNFPGRVLIIGGTVSGKELKKFKGKKINVIARNYPLTANQLTKKLGVTEGGDTYIIGCKVYSKEKPIILSCQLV